MLVIAKQGLWTGLAALALTFGLGIAAFAMFPIGGGEYHAIFAYTDAGRIRPALVAYTTYLGFLTVAAGVLVWTRYPARWWLIAAAAAVVGLRAWWGICTWEPQAAAFHTTVVALLPGFPMVLFPVCWALARHRRRAQPVSRSVGGLTSA